MSHATPHRLTDEQRQESFLKALERERALKELPELKAQLLAALDARESAWRAEHARLMHAAITGESAEGAQQPELPLSALTSAALIQAPAAVASPEDKQPPPEPPKGKRRTRSSKESAAESGKKRVGSTRSARTATKAQAAVRQDPAEDDLVPAPRVPCCACSHSIADHKSGRGRCERCKCRSFKPVVVAQPESLTEAEARGLDYPAECDGCAKEFKASELEPLGPEDARGYYCAACKAEVEEMDGGEEPQETLDEKLRKAENKQKNEGKALPAPAWAESLDASALLDAIQGPRDPSLDWRDTLEVSGTRSACELCGASCIEDGPTRARLSFSRFSKPKGAKSFDPSKVRGAGGILFTRWLCQTCATPERLAEERQAIQARLAEPEPSDVPAQVDAAPPAVPVDDGKRWWALSDSLEVAITQAGTPEARLWMFDMGDGPVVERGPFVVDRAWKLVPAGDAPASLREWLATSMGALQASSVSTFLTENPAARGALVACLPDAEPPAPPAKPKRTRSRANAKASPPLEEPAQAELLPMAAPVAAEPGTWRVELPERCEGRIVLLWLVNESTGERRAASWWGGTSSLKCGHHLSGKLEGAALTEHLELEAWWKANLESVVAPLEQACRDGKVPGLKVYEPEPSADGPYRYALSNGWVLEVWDTGEARVAAYFVGPTERADTQWRSGPFHLNGELLVASAVADITWSADNEEVVREAEDFIARGFVAELRRATSR